MKVACLPACLIFFLHAIPALADAPAVDRQLVPVKVGERKTVRLTGANLAETTSVSSRAPAVAGVESFQALESGALQCVLLGKSAGFADLIVSNPSGEFVMQQGILCFTDSFKGSLSRPESLFLEQALHKIELARVQLQRGNRLPAARNVRQADAKVRQAAPPLADFFARLVDLLIAFLATARAQQPPGPGQALGKVTTTWGGTTVQVQAPKDLNTMSNAELTAFLKRALALAGIKNGATIAGLIKKIRAGKSAGFTVVEIRITADSKDPDRIVVTINSAEMAPSGSKAVEKHESGHTQLNVTFLKKGLGKLGAFTSFIEVLQRMAPAGATLDRKELLVFINRCLKEGRKPVEARYDALEQGTTGETTPEEQRDDADNAVKLACIGAKFYLNAMQVCVSRELGFGGANTKAQLIAAIKKCCPKVLAALGRFMQTVTLKNLDKKLAEAGKRNTPGKFLK